jgi:hypothetical protein
LAIGEANSMEDDKILPLNSRHEKTWRNTI